MVVLSIPITMRRFKSSVSFGIGGDEELERIVRAQGNYAEYTPLALIALGMAEHLALGSPWVLAAAISLTAGRVLHAAALWGAGTLLRVIGMVLTYTALFIPAGLILVSLL